MPENTQTEELPIEVTEAAEKITDAKKSGKLVAILVAAAMSLIAILVLFFMLRRQGRELAKLKHEKNVNEERVKQAEANAEIAENQASFETSIEDARQAEATVVDLEDKIVVLQQSLADKKEAIQALSTWEDVSKYLEKK